MTQMGKRVLVTFIVGESWEEVTGPKYKRIRMAAFLKTGLAMSITGSNDNTVMCEGMTESVELAKAGTPFDDDAYISKAWSQHEKCFDAPAPVTPGAHAPAASDDCSASGSGDSDDCSVASTEKDSDSMSSGEQGEDSLSLDGADEPAYDDDVILEDLVKDLDAEAEKLAKEKNLFDSDSD